MTDETLLVKTARLLGFFGHEDGDVVVLQELGVRAAPAVRGLPG